ncbi:MAG: adenosine kinase [Bacteroidales bacterium]
MSKIAGIGNSLIDILYDIDNEEILKKYSYPKGSHHHVKKSDFDKLHRALEECRGIAVPGGSAANTISALANLGYESSFTGVVGEDEHGEMFESRLKVSGALLNLDKLEGDTGKIIHLNTPDRETTTIGYTGVNDQFSPGMLNEENFYGYYYLLIDGYLTQNEELMEALANFGRLNYMKVVFDLSSSHIAEGHREFLSKFIKEKVDILFANDLEVFSYTGLEPARAIGRLAKDVEIVVIKLGEKGSMIQKGDEFYQIPSVPVEVVDNCGAGDLYAAGFLYGLFEDYHLTHCGKTGAFLASKVLQVKGGRLSFDTWREIRKMI